MPPPPNRGPLPLADIFEAGQAGLFSLHFPLVYLGTREPGLRYFRDFIHRWTLILRLASSRLGKIGGVD